MGPKSSACCAFLSAWGIIFMALLGVAYHMYSPALREDLALPSKTPTEEQVKLAYKETGTNCLMTAALYAVTLVFSAWQVHVNNKASPYLVQ